MTWLVVVYWSINQGERLGTHEQVCYGFETSQSRIYSKSGFPIHKILLLYIFKRLLLTTHNKHHQLLFREKKKTLNISEEFFSLFFKKKKRKKSKKKKKEHYEQASFFSLSASDGSAYFSLLLSRWCSQTASLLISFFIL